jgi:predicted ArsR family transcriptional regulator
MHDRFFDSTRGKIVETLRARRSASAFELAADLGLSPNAIRQQLVILERDGLVTGSSVRRGKTKPTVAYTLTAQADRFFPQAYDKILNAVLREIRESQGDAGVARIFESIGKRAAERLAPRVADRPIEIKLEEIALSIRAQGVDAQVERTGSTIILHERYCPYANVVSENPEACSVIHTMLGEVAPDAVQTESLATGGAECRFEVPTATRQG